jgi:predicted porin
VLRERCEWPFARDAVKVYARLLLTIEPFPVNKDSNMQRSLIALAALATLGTSAFAQSTVTIYGRANVTIERQKVRNGPNNWVQQNNASRFGLKGSEDLGGGLKAGFQIEHGFNINDGRQTQSAFWARQSEVNLGSSSWGTVRLGNFTSEAYYATADYVSMHNHDTGTSSDAFYAYLGRNTSKVAYRTPNFGGATFEAAVTEAGASTEGRTVDLAANWDGGPLHLGFGYEKNDPQNALTSKKDQYAVRGLYEMGPFVFGGYVQRDKNVYGSGNRTTYRLSGMYTTGPIELHLNYGHAGDYSKTPGVDTAADQYTLGVNYNLSKRTKVYTFFTKVNDKAPGSGLLYGDFQSFAVGMRHNF